MNKEQIGIIIFSRMNSSRLPGKAMMPIGGIPLLERVIKRAKLTGFNVYLATSNNIGDDVLEELALKNGIGCFRGSLNNVLERGVKAAQQFNLKAFARLCGDRPLFSIEEMQFGLDFFQKMYLNYNEFNPDLITNCINGNKIKGLTTEVIRTEKLAEVLTLCSSSDHFEHMTSYIYQNANRFNILSVKELSEHKPKLKCYAIDELDDYKTINAVFEFDNDIGLSIEIADKIVESQLKS